MRRRPFSRRVPKVLRSPAVRFDNLAIVPASLLPNKVSYQRYANTRASYRQDLGHFAAWFGKSTGEAFAPQAVTPTDIRDYRAHLQTVERRAPATINRRLASLRAFFRYCVAGKQLLDSGSDLVTVAALLGHSRLDTGCEEHRNQNWR